ncbi:hypothetical protein [Pontibacter liquoris]|uniref:hypothetical protein n=1 Tax=Pontibacter liquoris TaxID=2905677 RepID=UPI001FA80A3E|nr:hypothetical protein [Pontibacter liquoris]
MKRDLRAVNRDKSRMKKKEKDRSLPGERLSCRYEAAPEHYTTPDEDNYYIA